MPDPMPLTTCRPGLGWPRLLKLYSLGFARCTGQVSSPHACVNHSPGRYILVQQCSTADRTHGSTQGAQGIASLACLGAGLVHEGGIATSDRRDTGEQWDGSNAWPPLQAMIIEGLQEHGGPQGQECARMLAQQWLASNFRGWLKHGQMVRAGTWSACPVHSHTLSACCAPRACFSCWPGGFAAALLPGPHRPVAGASMQEPEQDDAGTFHY